MTLAARIQANPAHVCRLGLHACAVTGAANHSPCIARSVRVLAANASNVRREKEDAPPWCTHESSHAKLWYGYGLGTPLLPWSDASPFAMGALPFVLSPWPWPDDGWLLAGSSAGTVMADVASAITTL